MHITTSEGNRETEGLEDAAKDRAKWSDYSRVYKCLQPSEK